MAVYADILYLFKCSIAVVEQTEITHHNINFERKPDLPKSACMM